MRRKHGGYQLVDHYLLLAEENCEIKTHLRLARCGRLAYLEKPLLITGLIML
jgi:hypothetical protein